MSAAFLAFFDRALTAPMITRTAADLGASPEEVSHTITVYVLAYAGAQVPWAALVGRIGQLRTLALASGLAAAATLAAATATSITTLTVARGIAGAALAAIVPTILVRIGEQRDLRARGVATVNLATALSLGVAVGTALAAALADWWSWRLAFAASAALGTVLCTLFALAPPPAEGIARVSFLASIPRIARNPWAHGVLALAAVEGALLVGVINYIPVALESVDVAVSLAGLAVASFGISVVAWAPAVRALVIRLPAWALLAAGGGAATAGYAILAGAISLATAAVAVIALGFSWACAHTQLQAWATDVMTGARPLGMALFGVALFGGGVGGSALGTWSVAADDFPALFAASCAIAAVFAVAAGTLRLRYRTAAVAVG
ncbi:MFS transporter [Demequina pelophila]|uniref:MFS transporter n=1 Tax=Demequina pelophila TaxID=1638984 RepID=UPI000786150C|nr:MFS transporter [Demequina pelophila]